MRIFTEELAWATLCATHCHNFFSFICTSCLALVQTLGGCYRPASWRPEYTNEKKRTASLAKEILSWFDCFLLGKNSARFSSHSFHCSIQIIDTNAQFFFGLSAFGIFMNSFIDQSYFWFVAEYLFLRFGLVYVTCSDSIHFSCYLFRQDFKLSTVPMGLDLQWNNFALNKSCTWRFPTFSWLWMWLQAKSWIDVVGVERTLIKRIPFFYWNGCIDVKGQSEIRLVKVGHLWRYLVQTSLIAFECYTTEDAERRCHFINWSWTLTILIMIVTG